MNNNFPQLRWLNGSGLGCWLTILLVSLFLGAVGLKWVVNSVLIILAFLFVAPIIGLWTFRWWLKRNLVEDSCPVCAYEFTGFNGSECRCPNCGEELKVEAGKFARLTPPGTIDVDVIEVSAKQIEN